MSSVPPKRRGRLRLQLSVPRAFDLFASRLEITDLQQSTVSTRQQAVRAALDRRLRVLDTFLTGSYRRHTMIGPLAGADVDLFCVLDPGYHHPAGQAALLDAVRKVLRETYPKIPRIAANGQAVTIRFTDFIVEVVPAFHRQGGGFLIPSSTEARWIETDPKVHEAFIANANAKHHGKLMPLIKMLKAWNRNSGSPLRSFYLELMTEAVLRRRWIGDYRSAATFVFERAREAVRWRAIDPAGLDEAQVQGLAHGGVPEVVAAFDLAARRARTAMLAERSGQGQRALSLWRQAFGSPFPGA
jgi:hypothetical protein